MKPGSCWHFHKSLTRLHGLHKGRFAYNDSHICLILEAVKRNVHTASYSQADLEEQLSTYFINARDRKGGRKERLGRKQAQQTVA